MLNKRSLERLESLISRVWIELLPRNKNVWNEWKKLGRWDSEHHLQRAITVIWIHNFLILTLLFVPEISIFYVTSERNKTELQKHGKLHLKTHFQVSETSRNFSTRGDANRSRFQKYLQTVRSSHTEDKWKGSQQNPTRPSFGRSNALLHTSCLAPGWVRTLQEPRQRRSQPPEACILVGGMDNKQVNR